MSQLKIKLTDIVSPKEMRYKQRAPIHILNNSIKRNTIFNPHALNHSPLTYDCKLPQLRMSRPEISNMLKYLLSKQEMSLPDRNLVRRILLDAFEEDLLEGGSRDFIRHINMLQGQEGEVLAPAAKQFYMVLRGKVSARSGVIQYQKGEGETFGQLELLSDCQLNQILFLKNTLLVTLGQQEFQRYFYSRYERKYQQIESQLECLQQFLSKIPKLSKYMLLSNVQRKVYGLGEKVILKGQALQHIIVVGDKLKEQQLKYVVKGCIGLYQLKKDSPIYEETVYSPRSQLELFFIRKGDFQNYVVCQNSQSLMKSSHLFLDKSFAKTTISFQNPEGNSKIVNFMRVRKVRMIPEKRSKTQPHSLLDNEFKFLKFDCLGIETSNYESKSTKYKVKNSFSISRNKRNSFK